MTEIELNDQDVVSARVGDNIVIRLDENATTGYEWRIDIAGSAVVSTGDAYVLPPDAQIGAAGKRVFTVTAAAPGAADIVLRLARPWESGHIEERRVHVTVQDN